MFKTKRFIFHKSRQRRRGGAAVILDVENYIDKANKEYENFCKKPNHDPTQEHMKITNDTIETFHRQWVLSKSSADNLKTTNVKTPQFYITLKIHQKNILVRPV